MFGDPGSDDDDDDKGARAKRGRPDASKRPRLDTGASSSSQSGRPQPPSDPAVLKSAEKLAAFVAKHGESFEETTKERNPGDTPFRFLFDKSSSDYKWYKMKLREHQQGAEGGSQPGSAATGRASEKSSDAPNTVMGSKQTEEGLKAKQALAKGDSLAAMDAYMQLAAKQEEKRGPVQDLRAMPPPDVLIGDKGQEKTFAVYKDDGKRGHHMGDYIPQADMDRFLAKQGDPAAQARLKAQELADRIGGDNKGHQMMQKMGWSDGAGLGASQSGMAAPISAGEVKQDNLGVGAANTHEVSEGDDIYEAYKKRMMLGYKHRPNPLGNPRKQYY